jgi:hypothetical protein
VQLGAIEDLERQAQLLHYALKVLARNYTVSGYCFTCYKGRLNTRLGFFNVLPNFRNCRHPTPPLA